MIPGVVQHGIVRTAATSTSRGIDCPGEDVFSQALGQVLLLVNDDAASRRRRYGGQRDQAVWSSSRRSAPASVALLYAGRLIPSRRTRRPWRSTAATPRRGSAPRRASRKESNCSAKWAGRLQRYYSDVGEPALAGLACRLRGLGARARSSCCEQHPEEPDVAPCRLQTEAGSSAAQPWLPIDQIRMLPRPARSREVRSSPPGTNVLESRALVHSKPS